MLFRFFDKGRKSPKRFANNRIQLLFEFSNRHFSEEFYHLWRSGMDKEFTVLVTSIGRHDWNYFEENIHLWDSINLFFIAECLIMGPGFYHREYAHLQRIYWLAFLHCETEEARNLADNIDWNLSLSVAVDIDLHDKVIERLNQLQHNLTI